MKASPLRTLLLRSVLAPFDRFVARQLGGPSGLFGRHVTTRLLNRGNRPLIEATLDALGPRPHESLLDVGFGGGLALELAARRGVARLAGADPSPDAVSAARSRLRLRRLHDARALRLVCAPVEDLPFESGELDTALSTNTIYFWSDLGPPLAELQRVLRPRGGRLALGFSGAEKLRSFDRVTRHGFALREPDEVARALEAAGFGDLTLSPLRGRVTTGDFVVVAHAP